MLHFIDLELKYLNIFEDGKNCKWKLKIKRFVIRELIFSSFTAHGIQKYWWF